MPPRLYWDRARDTWAILHNGKRTRLGLARGEADAAQVRLAEYVLAQAKGAPAPPPERPASQVLCDEALELYLARRTDPNPDVRDKTVARPRELAQRIGALAVDFGGRPVTAVDDRSCAAFVRRLGSESYGRRCLGDLQSALNEAQRAGLFRE